MNNIKKANQKKNGAFMKRMRGGGGNEKIISNFKIKKHTFYGWRNFINSSI
jgi:hypothetical protein